MPRLSVLLPTRHGGDYLEACVRSALQPGADVELVVSDNANDDATPAILDRFAGDPRLVRLRQDELLSVTQNWNATLEASTGDYLLMIGDDDLLRPGYFEALASELSRWDEPECLTYNGIRFIEASAVAGRSEARWARPYFPLDAARFPPGPLSPALRRNLVEEFFTLRFAFPLTMQVTLVARQVVQRLPRGLFNSPFPDHYGLGALLLRARTWALTPIEPIIIGVSEKSFGHYFLSADDAGGLEYLGVRGERRGELPGSEVLNTQVAWLGELRDDFTELAGVDVDRGAYVLRQIWTWARQRRRGAIGTGVLLRRLRRLGARDAAVAVRTLASEDVLGAARSALGREWAGSDRAAPLDATLRTVPPDVRRIDEFSAWLQRSAAA